MTDDIPGHVERVLESASEGGVSFDELAEALDYFDQMAMVLPNESAVEFLSGLNEALDEKGMGEPVKASDAEAPEPAGTTDDQGRFVPYVFTSNEAADEYARLTGEGDEEGNVFTVTKNWAAGVGEILESGWGGMVIDPGKPYAVGLDRAGVRNLYAAMTVEALAEFDAWWAVSRGDEYLVVESGGEHHAQVFSSREVGHVLPVLEREYGPGLDVEAVRPAEFLEFMLRNGIEHLQVDPATNVAHHHPKRQLVGMIEHLGAEVPEPGGSPEMASRSDVPDVLQKARRLPDLPPVPPPGLSPGESRQRYQKFQRLVANTEPTWREYQLFSRGIDFFVGLHGQNVDGLMWPQMHQDVVDQQQVTCFVFTTEAGGEEALSERASNFQNYRHLSGTEVLRWIWAAPTQFHNLSFDIHRLEEEGVFRWPVQNALAVLFPQIRQIPDLRDVEACPTDELVADDSILEHDARLIRQMAFNWRDLFTARMSADDTAPGVDWAGGRYVPIFTSTDAAISFTGQFEQGTIKPVRAEDVSPGSPPFLELVIQAAGCDGAVFNPASDRPLFLEPFDLLGYHLWASDPDQQPGEPEYREALRELEADGRLDSESLGELVAHWPMFIAVLTQMGFQHALVTAPDGDTVVAFTGGDTAKAYVSHYQSSGELAGAQTQLQPLMSQWSRNIFQSALDIDSDLLIDPPPANPDDGVRLDREALEAARDWLELHLKPRVDGFVDVPFDDEW